jgi:HD superfamily phosphodiesterase
MNDVQLPPHRSQQDMQSAGYFRDQATLCLEIARHISNPQAVQNLHASARHLVKADNAEKRSGGAPIHQSRSGGTIQRL